MARERVERAVIQDRPVRPQASAVNTYVAPADTGPARGLSGLEALARSMEGMRPTLKAYADASKERLDLADAAEAQARYAQSGARIQEAVAKGLLPKNASPVYRQAYAEAELRDRAREYNATIAAAYNERSKSEPGFGTDPVALSQWEREQFLQYAQSNLQGHHDADILKAFDPRRGELVNGLQNHAIKEKAAREDAAFEAAFRNDLVETAGMLGSGNDDAVAGHLTRMANDYVAVNYDKGTQTNKAMVDVVTALAQERDDMSILGVLDKIRTGPDGKGVLGRTAYAMEQMDAARDEQVRERRAAYSHGRAVAAENRRVQMEKGTRILNRLLLDDPFNEGIPALIAEFNEINPRLAASAHSAMVSFRNEEVRARDNPELVADFMARARTGETAREAFTAQVYQAIADQQLEVQTAGRILSQFDSNANIKPLMDLPAISTAMDNFKRVVLGAEDDWGANPERTRAWSFINDMVIDGMDAYMSEHGRADTSVARRMALQHFRAIRQEAIEMAVETKLLSPSIFDPKEASTEEASSESEAQAPVIEPESAVTIPTPSSAPAPAPQAVAPPMGRDPAVTGFSIPQPQREPPTLPIDPARAPVIDWEGPPQPKKTPTSSAHFLAMLQSYNNTENPERKARIAGMWDEVHGAGAFMRTMEEMQPK